MAGKKLSEETVELFDNHLTYLAESLDDIQKHGRAAYGLDWDTIWQVLIEMREKLGLPDWFQPDAN